MGRTILFLLAAVTLGATSCCNCRQSRKLERPLMGTTWQLIQLMAQDVAAEDDSYTVVFHADGNVSGRGECNALVAQYTTTESRALDIHNIGSTRRLCPNQEQENSFFDMLDGVTHYEMDADKMLLLSNGTLVAILQAR